MFSLSMHEIEFDRQFILFFLKFVDFESLKCKHFCHLTAYVFIIHFKFISKLTYMYFS